MSDVIRAQPGPQERALASPADVVIFGGGAGGGKSWGLLLSVAQHAHVPEFAAEIFRRTYPELTMTGGLWPESARLFRYLRGEPNEGSLRWAFPSGATAKFSHMQHAKDRYNWDGAQVPMIGWDQLESFEEEQFWYLLSRNRNPRGGGLRPWVFATCNPVPADDPVGGWLHRLVQWWLDAATGTAIPARSGAPRWVVRDGDALDWADDPAALRARHGAEAEPKSFTFIESRLEDNPALAAADPGYRASLMLLPLVERERLLGRNWNSRPTAGRLFNRAWFPLADAAPVDARRVRYWDKAGTEGGGDWSAGVRLARADDGGAYYVEDVVRGRWSAHGRNRVIRQVAEADGLGVDVWVEQEPGPIWVDERVVRGDGSIARLGDIRIGDRLITRHGVSARVERVVDRGEIETITISLASGRTLCLAPDHRCLTPHGWVRAGEIAIGGAIALRAHSRVDAPLETPTAMESRLAGYLMGDGCVTWAMRRSATLIGPRPAPTSEAEWERRRKISAARRRGLAPCNASVVCSDPLQGVDVTACAESIGAIVAVTDRRGWTYRMKGPAMRAWLHARGLAGMKTADKIVPTWIAKGGDAAVANFIGAFFMCDGCASVDRDGRVSVEMCNTSRQLLIDIQSLLLRFGVYSVLRERHHGGVRRVLYVLGVRIGDDSAARFAERIPTFGRKTKILAAVRRRAFDQDFLPDVVMSVVSGGRRRCVCLSVDAGESFLANDIVVHNSGGKESAEISIQQLDGWAVRADRPSADLVVRSGPLRAQAEAGNVRLVRGPWVEAFLAELHAFDGRGRGHDDQVSAAAGAHNKLALRPGAPRVGRAAAPSARVILTG